MSNISLSPHLPPQRADGTFVRETVEGLFNALKQDFEKKYIEHTNQYSKELKDKQSAKDAANLKQQEGIDRQAKDAYDAVSTKLSRAYHDLLQVCNNIQLYCKVRPPPFNEKTQKCADSLTWAYERFDVKTETEQYGCHHVFGPRASNDELHNALRPMLESAQQNSRHVLLIGFGESGSGKSTTLYQAGRIKQLSIIEQLANDLWGEESPEALKWSAGLMFVEMQASDMYSLINSPLGSAKQKVKISQWKNEAEMTGVPENARYTDNTFIAYDNKAPGTQYYDRQWVKGRDNFINMVSAGLKQRENEATTNNETSSCGCALLEICLKYHDKSNGIISRGVITLVDLMGKEDFSDITKTKKRDNFNAGALNVNALCSILRAISKHKNRAASTAKGPSATREDKINNNHQYAQSALYHLVHPIKNGLVCDNGAKPRVAVIAHICDCVDNVNRNMATLRDMKELQGMFDVAATENCASCSKNEMKISELEEERDYLVKRLDIAGNASGQPDKSVDDLTSSVKSLGVT